MSNPIGSAGAYVRNILKKRKKRLTRQVKRDENLAVFLLFVYDIAYDGYLVMI